MRTKKAQLTVFIIIGLIIIAGVVLIFLFRAKVIQITPEKQIITDPNRYIEKCAEDATEEALVLMLPQAGYLNATSYKLYHDNKVQYLCYNQNYYSSCINQEPLYIQHIKDEIKSYIKPRIDGCFISLKADYEKTNNDVELGIMQVDVNLFPKQVRIEILRNLTITKNDNSIRRDKFKAIIPNPIYDLAVIAQEIVNQEAKFCYFEYLGFMLLYPAFEISKMDINGEDKIYTVKDKESEKELLFAVRSCSAPAGL